MRQLTRSLIAACWSRSRAAVATPGVEGFSGSVSRYLQPRVAFAPCKRPRTLCRTWRTSEPRYCTRRPMTPEAGTPGSRHSTTARLIAAPVQMSQQATALAAPQRLLRSHELVYAAHTQSTKHLAHLIWVPRGSSVEPRATRGISLTSSGCGTELHCIVAGHDRPLCISLGIRRCIGVSRTPP
jgi:hypothetical protein